MNQEQERIISRVKKLIALANDAGASEGERDNALRMAHATLGKYNLSMSQVNEHGIERGSDCIMENSKWAIHVASAVGKLFFCNYFYSNYRQYAGAPWTIKHSFVGQTANVATAKLMALYVVDSIKKEAIKRGGDAAAIASFQTGAAYCISRRCTEIINSGKMADSDGTAGTAVVLASHYKTEAMRNAEFMRKIGIRLGAAEHIVNTLSNADAYYAGRDFANGISLNAQVGGNGEGTRLLK